MDRYARSDKAIMDLIERDRKKKKTREEILEFFVNAGILDKDRNFTEPYKDLAKYVRYLDRE